MSLSSAASLLNSNDNLPPSSTEAASEDLLTSLNLGCEKVAINLPDLPTEIILDVAKYLAPSSQVSLSYSCRQIRNKMGASLIDILAEEQPMASLSDSTLSIESQNIRWLERLKLRSMLLRDGKIFSVRWCVGCKVTHDTSLFPMSSRPQPSTGLRCLGRANRMWICPHRIIDYDQAADSYPDRDVHNCGGVVVSLDRPDFRLRDFKFHTLCIWPLVFVRGESAPSRELVQKALRSLNAPVCPHLRLNDARIAELYLPNWQRQRCELCTSGSATPVCRCWSRTSEFRFQTVCDFCGTQLVFMIRPHPCRGFCIDVLSLVLMRRIRDVRSPIDRSWIRQVADPVDFREYAMAWYASNAFPLLWS